jgi:superoxide dismutase
MMHYSLVQKHHATYVNNLNVASEKLADAQARGDISAVIALQGAIKFNGAYVCMYACMHVCMYVCACVCTCVYVCICICVCVCVCVCE